MYFDKCIIIIIIIDIFEVTFVCLFTEKKESVRFIVSLSVYLSFVYLP